MYLKINNPIQTLFLEELVAKKNMSLLVDQVHFGLANTTTPPPCPLLMDLWGLEFKYVGGCHRSEFTIEKHVFLIVS